MLQIRSHETPRAHDGHRIFHAAPGPNRRKPRRHGRGRREQEP